MIQSLRKEPYDAVDQQTQTAKLTDDLNKPTDGALKDDRPLRFWNSVRLCRPSAHDDSNNDEQDRCHAALLTFELTGLPKAGPVE